MKEVPKEPLSKRHGQADHETRARPPAPSSDGMSNRARLSLLRRRRSPRTPEGASSAPAAHQIADVLAHPGQPLEPDVRRDSNERFGHDFSHVRVHKDAKADESARAMRARAYTVGRDVVFSEGQYAPHSPQGSQLLAHELAHVIQQERGGSVPAISHDAAHERDADAAATAAVGGERPVSVSAATGIGVARSPLDLFDTSTPDLSPWSNQTPDLKSWSVEKLETTLLQIEEWLATQTSSSPQTELADTAAAQIRRELAVIEAEAAIASTEQTIQEDEDEDAEIGTSRAPTGPTSLSLLTPDQICQGACITDEEIYESIREPTPEESAYWERQEQEWLDKTIVLGSETKYVRTWHDETIPGVGDQGDRTVAVEYSHWTMTTPALRGYLTYLVGELTPFEEKLAGGDVDLQNGLTVVSAGGAIGYAIASSGYDNDKVYNRDGTIYSFMPSDTALVNMGIGPLALALPGGIRSLGGLAGGAVRVGRAGLSTAGRIVVGAGRKLLKPAASVARKGAITVKLALGRAEAGAAIEGTAIAGTASRNAVVLVETRAAQAAAQPTIARATAQTGAEGAAAVPSIQSTAPPAAQVSPQAGPTVVQPPANVPPTGGIVASISSVAQMDPRHARGYGGEQSMGFNLYPAEQGWIFVEGPSGQAGHGVTTSGFDGLAYNPQQDFLDIIDNKSLKRAGNVSSATAIDPAKNLGQNLDAAIQRVQGMTDLPNQSRILQLLQDARQALRAGRPLPSQVRLVVTHQGGQTTGVTSTLAGRGVISR